MRNTILPKTWKILPLSETADIKFSTIDKKIYEEQRGVILCNYTDVFYNKRITSGIEFMSATASEAEVNKFTLLKGDVVFTKDSETPEEIGICTYVAENIANLVCGYHLGIARSKPKVCLGEYLSIVMNFHPVHHQLVRVANGVTRYGLTLESISQAYIPIPPLAEQQKIADILCTWDEAIEKVYKIIKAKETKKAALAQRLLTGKVRMPSTKSSWKSVKLRDVTTEIKTRNQNGKFGINKVMGVNKVHGLIPMREETIGARIERYKTVPPQAFAYNPMRINIGSLAMSEKDETVLVSPDYVVFSCDEGKLDTQYFNQFRRSHIWEKYMEAAGNGSVRIRIYYNDLADMKIFLPSIQDQKIIAEILCACDAELIKLKEQLEAYKAQKRGLMQKLLTGQWRVKTSNTKAA